MCSFLDAFSCFCSCRLYLPTLLCSIFNCLSSWEKLVLADTFVLFVRIPDGLTAEDRILAVLEFYLTSFHAGRKVRSSLFYLYTSRGRKVGVWLRDRVWVRLKVSHCHVKYTSHPMSHPSESFQEFEIRRKFVLILNLKYKVCFFFHYQNTCEMGRIIMYFMTGLEGNSEFCFPEALSVFLASGNIDFEVKQNSLFPAESVTECFVRSPNSKIAKKNCEKSFAWCRLAHKFAAVSMSTT